MHSRAFVTLGNFPRKKLGILSRDLAKNDSTYAKCEEMIKLAASYVKQDFYVNADFYSC